ncbi:tRNA (adenosine(37)-N6)-threonylcarbamoyltransferase complex ATPase subunit type 1 TsaE [Roseovarius phycicola]|uniref:tRNA threonylcarbamoyladenosine biosynthesis protein TsaE n=1 Tax=Roseovarius phycicola TaxID=3080976 RepID=A0ABZ2HGF0_9RHOB
MARRIATHLAPGDTLLLIGEIGAGKTYFARELLSDILLVAEDVPSPTFTIVQTYDSKLGEVWHADLYRLETSSDVIELGLLDAFGDAICLVEWPDRLGEQAPVSALSLAFLAGTHDDERNLILTWQTARWDNLSNEIGHD